MNVPNLAFYIGRTLNRNVVIYTFNIKDDVIDLFEPLKINWIMREKDNDLEDLTYLESSMAYGYEVLNNHTKDIALKIKALPEHTVLIRRVDNKYKCIINIDDTSNEQYLKKVFVHHTGNIQVNVTSIDIIYEDPETGKLHTYVKTTA